MKPSRYWRDDRFEKGCISERALADKSTDKPSSLIEAFEEALIEQDGFDPRHAAAAAVRAEKIFVQSTDLESANQETLLRFVDFLTKEKADVIQAGRLCLLFAFRLRRPYAPTTLDQLAVRLGVSKTRAHQLVQILQSAERNIFDNQRLTQND